jgi:hypothetical protein
MENQNVKYVEESDSAAVWRWSYRIGLVAAVLTVSLMAGCPPYNVWQQGLQGQAELRRAEQNRQIRVQEAIAHQESAGHLAQSEIERAKGVAEANRIIGASLQNNEGYLRYLWVHSIENTKNSVIYVPTEANLPILEASRLK